MKTFFVRYLGIGILMYILSNIVLFILSMLFRFETAITPLASIVFALLMGAISYLFLRKITPSSSKEALGYTAAWAGIVLLLLLIVTIANDTTQVFFGQLFNYLIFIAIVAASLLPRASKEVKKAD